VCGRRTTGTIAISLCGLVPAESDLTVVELLSATRAETSGPARCVTELLASYRQHGYVQKRSSVFKGDIRENLGYSVPQTGAKCVEYSRARGSRLVWFVNSYICVDELVPPPRSRPTTRTVSGTGKRGA
jgi:hypothetical protein